MADIDDREDLDTEAVMPGADPENDDVEKDEMIPLDEDEEEEEEAPPNPQFYANLAEKLPEAEMDDLAGNLLELIERDREAREKRDKQYEDGLRRTGLGGDAPGGATFEGASKVVHPMLAEACVDFAARAIKEIFPANGPVKDRIIGEVTNAKIKKAKRKVALMNWQLTTQCLDFRATLEQALTQVPLAGASYIKIRRDEGMRRPEFIFVPIDEMLLPFAAANFYTARRRTHVQYLTVDEFRDRVKSGMYRDVDLIPVSTEPEKTASAVANDKIEGKSATSYNEDGLRLVYEVYLSSDVETEGDFRPYIVTVDENTSKVLSVYRNWSEDDEKLEELHHFVELPFIPWRGAYPIGLPHLIGGMSAAATGALRALMDSAHIANSQTAVKLKGSGSGGQSVSLAPTQVEEIDGGIMADDIRKMIMPLPYPGPSPVLFQLMEFITQAARGVVRTTMEDAADTSAQAPVGTTLARIEQGMVVFSAIHSRLHAAMGRILTILHRLNAVYLNEEEIEEDAGEEFARRDDFTGPMDVEPVSDPNIFSETQRFAQVQAVAQRAALLPQIYKLREVEQYVLNTLKIPNADSLLIPAVEPKEQNAVNENVTAVMGRPILAFPEQDHIAHLRTHIAFLLSPALGSGSLMAPTFVPAVIGHIKEHVALWYARSVFDLANEEAGVDIGEKIKLNKSSEDRQAFDRMLAEAALTVTAVSDGVFEKLPPVIEAAIQIAQKYQMPTPMDPAQVAAQESQRKGQESQMKMQLEATKAQAAAESDAQRLQVDTQRLQLEGAKAQAAAQSDAQKAEFDAKSLMSQEAIEKMRLALTEREAQLREQQAQADRQSTEQLKREDIAARREINTQDNLTAIELAKAELATGERFAASTGTGINPGTR